MSHQRNQNNSTSDVVWQELKISASMRAESKHQKPCCIWLTGLSGSGKSTVANELDVTLHKMGRHTYLLDGDNVRHGLCRDLGMTDEDRSENIRRVGEVAKLMVDAGLVVICAFISPFRSDRDTVRSSFKDGEFFEVHISAALEVCEKRDPKGLYKKARQGQIQHFTGIDSPYEPPLAPEIIVDTAELTPKDSVKKIITELTDLLEVVHKLPVDSAGN